MSESTQCGLCSRCGERLTTEMKQCPTCGMANPHNLEIVQDAVETMEREYKAVKKFAIGFLVFFLLVGFALFVANMGMLFAGVAGTAFFGAVAAGVMVVLCILGMVKDEDVIKGVLVCGGVSVWMLVMSTIFL